MGTHTSVSIHRGGFFGSEVVHGRMKWEFAATRMYTSESGQWALSFPNDSCSASFCNCWSDVASKITDLVCFTCPTMIE